MVAAPGDSVPGDDVIRAWVRAVFEKFPDASPIEVSVRIVDESESRSLNSRYRGKDNATNVLSFPAGDEQMFPAGMPKPIGDIVICGAVVLAEANAQEKDVDNHWAHMVVHGTLHLLGYDHEVSEEADAMEAIETQILASRGVPNPYLP